LLARAAGGGPPIALLPAWLPGFAADSMMKPAEWAVLSSREPAGTALAESAALILSCPSWATETGGERSMLSWSLIFLIIAIVAAMFGFGGIAGTAAWMAKVLFIIFLVIFVASLIFGRRGPQG